MTSQDSARVVVSEAASVSGDFDESRRRSRAGSETQELESSAGSELASALLFCCFVLCFLNAEIDFCRIARTYRTWFGPTARSVSTSRRCKRKLKKKKTRKKTQKKTQNLK
jgi:hypothetical protein